mmetsp:Transcript_52587/g.151626  ORF Transcript_52587/g.151626 Transcript_52587/m.151626 type:complete len:249 (+) Transcript_52587:911-1657(+)
MPQGSKIALLDRQASMSLAEVPLVEPMRRDAVFLFHLNAPPKEAHGLLVVAQAAVYPTEIPVDRVIQLPLLVRLESDQGLELLVHLQGLLEARLLHPHSRVHVQQLEEPKPASLSAQGRDAAAYPVRLVDLVVLQVAADQVERCAQAPVVVQHSRHLPRAQARQCQRARAAGLRRDGRHLVGYTGGAPHEATVRASGKGVRAGPLREEPTLSPGAGVSCDEREPAAHIGGEVGAARARLQREQLGCGR